MSREIFKFKINIHQSANNDGQRGSETFNATISLKPPFGGMIEWSEVKCSH